MLEARISADSIGSSTSIMTAWERCSSGTGRRGTTRKSRSSTPGTGYRKSAQRRTALHVGPCAVPTLVRNIDGVDQVDLLERVLDEAWDRLGHLDQQRGCMCALIGP